MKILKKVNLLFFIMLPLYLLGMETDAAYAQFVKDVKALPSDIRTEIFKHKCVQLCPQLIDKAQTVLDVKELFTQKQNSQQ